MHPDKADALGKLTDVSRELDSDIHRLKDVVGNPTRDGWASSVKALATLPFLGAGAVIVDACAVLLRLTADSRWDDSSRNNSAAPPDGGF